MPVLQVHAGEEKGHGNLLKEEEDKGEEDEEKEEDMEGKRRDEEEMQDGLVVEEGLAINFPLVSFLCSSCSEVLPV